MNKEEAAARLEVKPRTIERYTKNGKLHPAYIRGPHGLQAEFSQDDVDRCKKERVTAPPRKESAKEARRREASALREALESMLETIKAATVTFDASIQHQNALLAKAGTQATKELWLSLAEAAEMSGLSKGELRKAIKQDRLKGSLRIKRKALEAYVDSLSKKKR